MPEIHSKELEDSIAQSESTAETSENASPSEGSKKKSTQIAAEKIATQIEKLDDMPSKTCQKTDFRRSEKNGSSMGHFGKYHNTLCLSPKF